MSFYYKSVYVYLMLISILIFIVPLNLHAFSLNKNIITDDAGRKIRIEKPFKKIISLYGAHTENLFFLKADEHLIGVTKNETYPEKAKKLPRFSYHDDPEKFLAFGPDLVLIRPMIDRGYSDLMKRLEKSNITVISIQPSSILKMYEYWEILGLLTGRQGNAEKMIDDFKEKIEEYKRLSKKINKRKNVYFESIHTKMKTFTKDSMAVFVLETAGGINIASDAIQVRNTNIASYGKEKILSKSGKIDVFLAQTGVMNKPDFHMIKNEPGFKVIKAVKDNQIYFIDEMLVSRPSFRLLHGVQKIGSVLYPEVFY